MSALHSAKVTSEKNAFLAELFASIPTADQVLTGQLGPKARRLHQTFLPAYILKHYNTQEFRSDYFNVVSTNLIEAESLLALGFRNSGMASMRGAVESAFKFLYYEYHPIEWMLHNDDGKHTLTGTEYRQFAYNFPGLSQISFMNKDTLELLWKNLCKFVHSDIRVLKQMTVVSDIKSLLSEDDNIFNSSLDVLKQSMKVIIAILFAVNPQWAAHVEKVYYDAILETFSVTERKEIRDNLRIS